MKRFISLVLALIMALSLFVGVSAKGADYTYTLLADGKVTAKVKLGDQVAVTFNVRENNSQDTTSVWSMQGYIMFDPDYLEIAEISPAVVDGKSVFNSTAVRTYSRVDSVLTNRLGGDYDNTVEMENPYVAVTVTFNTLKNGTTDVRLNTCEAMQPAEDGTYDSDKQRRTVESEDATIIIGDGEPAPTIYTVTFDYADGTGRKDTLNVEEGGKLTRPSDPKREGYDFAGWYSGNKLWDFAKDTVTEETNLTARWNVKTPEKVTLSFSTNGGSTISSIQRDKGATVSLAGYKPTRDGYDFVGWYSDAELTNPVTSVVLDKDMTVYAKWAEKAKAKYTITFDNDGADKKISPVTDVEGTVIDLTDDKYIPTKNGYRFDGWYDEDGNKVTSVTLGENITLKAKWVKLASDTVTLKFDTNGGSSISDKVFDKGARVNLDDYTTRRSGYTFDGWYFDSKLTDEAGDTFVINADTTVYAKWVKKDTSGSGSGSGNVSSDDEDKLPFTDVSKDKYYYEPVKWAVDKGITTGTSATTFSPDGPCTRAQMVTFLWRTSGCPEAKSTACPFTDVQTDAYYYKALLWAIETGVTKGTSPTTFSPNDICTRGQMVTFLHRYNGEPSVSAGNPFTDVTLSDFFYTAVVWAADNGITNGTSATTFSPFAPCTRAQIVTFLYRSVNG